MSGNQASANCLGPSKARTSTTCRCTKQSPSARSKRTCASAVHSHLEHADGFREQGAQADRLDPCGHRSIGEVGIKSEAVATGAVVREHNVTIEFSHFGLMEFELGECHTVVAQAC